MRRLKISHPRFRLPLSEADAYRLLCESYLMEVKDRHREMVGDDFTKGNIAWLARELTQETPKLGILLCGTCGNGKTTLVMALRDVVNYLNAVHAWSENTGIRMVDAKDLARLATKSPEEFEKMKKVPMLAIDDLGKEPVEVLDYGNVLSPVVELIEYRYDKQLFTIMTSNVPPKEISKRYGERVADRLREMMAIRAYEGKTYRT